MDDRNADHLRPPLAGLLLIIAISASVDLFLDRPASWLTFHVIYEGLLAIATLCGAAWLWSGWRRAAAEGAQLRQSLAQRQEERDRWRADAERVLAGFAGAVNRQFDAWRLTPAEREVALRLLKGQGHKEIAQQTGRSERTVRQHAAAAYAKAGLDGRAALAGFFLEGLQLPAEGDAQGEAS